MTKPISEIVSELEAALAKMPQEEWVIEADATNSFDLKCGGGRSYSLTLNHSDDMDATDEAIGLSITLAHNHLEALIADWRRQQAQIDLLQQSLVSAEAKIAKLRLRGTLL